MAEWFKAADCKSVEFSHRRFKSYSLLTKYSAVGSVPVLGTGGHVFKSHYFEIFFNIYEIFKLLFNTLYKLNTLFLYEHELMSDTCDIK